MIVIYSHNVIVWSLTIFLQIIVWLMIVRNSLYEFVSISLISVAINWHYETERWSLHTSELRSMQACRDGNSGE